MSIYNNNNNNNNNNNIIIIKLMYVENQSKFLTLILILIMTSFHL